MHSLIKGRVESTEVAVVTNNMVLVTVHYADSRELLVNGDCGQNIFLDYIRRKLNESDNPIYHVTPDMVIDLCDITGVVRGIRRQSLTTNVAFLLEHRSVYVPVRVVQHADNDDAEYTILLSAEDKLHALINDSLTKMTKRHKSKDKKAMDKLSHPRSPTVASATTSKTHSVAHGHRTKAHHATKGAHKKTD